MGIKVLVDLETNRGPTKELYVRIDSWKINTTVNEITFTTTSWIDKEHGDRFRRKYYTDDLKPAIGLVSGKVIYYEDSSDEGQELEVPNLYKVPMIVEKEVEEDIFEEKEVTKEVPYVSFDKEGEEITLYRTVTVTEKVKTGTKVNTKQVVDYGKINRLEEFSYNHLVKKLGEVFPETKIKKIE